MEISCRRLNLLRLSSYGDWPPSGEHGRSGAFLSESNPIHVDHSMRTGVCSFCSLEVSFLWGRTYSDKTVKANRIHCAVLIQAMSKLISIDQTTDAHGKTSYGAKTASSPPPGNPNSTPVTFYGSEQYCTRNRNEQSPPGSGKITAKSEPESLSCSRQLVPPRYVASIS